jgi:hypothetical protein
MQPLQPLQRRGSWLWAQGRPAQEDSSTGSANPDGWTAPLLFTGLHKVFLKSVLALLPCSIITHLTAYVYVMHPKHN